MKKIAFHVAGGLLTLLVIVGLSEGLLRATGVRPWKSRGKDAHEPTMHEPDPVLGWRNREGSYVVSPYEADGDDIRFTFSTGGLRITGSEEGGDGGEIVLVGGSYTQGWAIDDHETFGWKLQQRFPGLTVLNWGTAGYGTVQSLLVLEQQLPKLPSPLVVVYGFVDHHETRNVAPAGWLRSLSLFSRRGHVDAPYATLDDQGQLVRHPPERYLALPLHDRLATVAFLESTIMRRRTARRLEQKTPVTEAALLEMNRLCEEYGATLLVVLLRARAATKGRYVRFLNAREIRFVDCVQPMPAEMRVPGEGHPNGRMHSRWTDCIAQAITRIVPAAGERPAADRETERRGGRGGALPDPR